MRIGTRSTPAAGVALILTGAGILGASLLELATGARGDADNPTDSLAFLSEHGELYSYSGSAFTVAGVALVVAVLGIWQLVGTVGLAFASASVLGILGGGFLIVNGILRMQSVGTVPYIESMDQSWGESAYLAVQMAGTQGLMSAGLIILCAWLVSLGLLFARRRIWGTAAFAAMPAMVLAILLADLLIPGLDELGLDGLFVVYAAGLAIGVPLCCAAFGISATLPRVRERLRLAPASTRAASL